MDASSILNKLQSKDVVKDREEIVDLAYALAASLLTPSEFIGRVGWAEPALFTCLRTAVDLGIFAKLDEAGVLSTEQLATATKADPALIARIMRHLVAMHVIAEKPEGFANTKVAAQLTDSRYNDSIICTYDIPRPAFGVTPTYLAETAYANPLNPLHGPFQKAHATDLHYFPWLLANKTYLPLFINYMAGYRQGKSSWMDQGFYPVQDRLARNLDPDDVLLVDVGGGSGHDLLELKQKLPSLPGKLILQDTPETINSLAFPANTGITPQAHDFFTPQPVRGARAYFLHSVLHDWDDASCLRILAHLRDAMGPQSKLLIHELVVPAQGAKWGLTSMDLLMMVSGAVRERTKAEWKAMLNQAGFEVEQIWAVKQDTESLIEAVVKK